LHTGYHYTNLATATPKPDLKLIKRGLMAKIAAITAPSLDALAENLHIIPPKNETRIYTRFRALFA
jgi:hypothetical protein